jgi:hypothetical protein
MTDRKDLESFKDYVAALLDNENAMEFLLYLACIDSFGYAPKHIRDQYRLEKALAKYD